MAFLSAGGTVGLELDDGEARAVELRGNARKPVLAAWGRMPLPAGAVVDGMVVKPEVVGQALAELWSKNKIGRREVLLGVGNNSLFVRFGTFPKVPPDKLENVIRYQAQDFLPISLNSLVLDYAVIEEDTGGSVPLLNVLLVAARREMLEPFLTALNKARLTPEDIDATPLALLRLPCAGDRSGAVILVNVANGLSTIVIAVRGVPRLARICAVNLRGLAALAGRSVEEVVGLTGGTPGSDLPSEALLSWSESLAEEISSSVDYYRAQPGAAAEIEGIMLSGRGARVQGLFSRLKESLGVPVWTVQPLQPISVPARAGTGLESQAPDFAVSISLAWRGLKG